MTVFGLLVRQRLVEVLRSRTAAFFVFLLPLLLLGTVGLVFANGHPFERHRIGVVGDAPAWPELARGDVKLESTPSEAVARARIEARMLDAAIVDGRLLAPPGQELFGRGLASTRAPVEVVPVDRWGFVRFLFPGIVSYVVVLGGLFGMGHLMVRLRQNLFLKKLATTPIPKPTFVAAMLASRTLVTLAQVALLVGAAEVAVGLPLGPAAVLWLAVLVPLGLWVFMGVGFSLACVIETEAAMVDAISVTSLPLVFLSEIFFPVDDLPAPLRWASQALPSTWLVRGLRLVLVERVVDPGALATPVAVLVAWAVATFAFSLAVFRWTK